ncbi:MAG: hypothetical protein ACTSV1_04695, partial [Alphaproteobacteria bacterium]
LNGKGGNNRWLTEVQCVLKRGDDSTATAWLSHECRAEGVPFAADFVDRGDTIFMRDKPWEFLVYRAGEETRQLTTAALTIVESNIVVDNMVPPMTDMTGGSDSEVHCPERAIREIAHDEALAALRAGSLSIRSTFMRISWAAGGDSGDSYDLYCPCRYINFPEVDGPDGAYIQPISGYVLYPVAEGLHMLAYVACATNLADDTIVEFCCRRYKNVFGWARSELGGESDELLKNLEGQLPIIASSFDGMFPIKNGEFSLFTYV